MSYFWDVVDWLLPPVRIIDDLTDHPSDSYRRPSHHHSSHSSRRLSGKEHDKDRERDRDRDRDRERRRDKERASGRDRERTRDRERERRVSSEGDREREQLRQRVQQLERENESLLEQLRSTREELSKLSTAVFPTPSQSLSTSYPTSPPDALGLVHPISPPTPTPLSPTSHTSTTFPVAVQHSAEGALTDPKRLRVLYTSLRATYSDARQTILSQAEELASLKGFLSKTDDWSGAQLLQALADLNSEIIQLSASVAEEFAANLRTDPRSPTVAKERDREVVRPALGKEMLKLLEGREHAQDPTLVQFALQAWQVWCVARVMDAFCYGLPAEVDESLRTIFERMQREEPQPTTSRWRALTYRHARSLLFPHLPSEPSSPDTVTRSPFNSAPASLASSSSLPPPLLSLTEANLRGVLAILALSGCTDARGLHRDPLRARFGSALSRISARAERISGVVKEGVLSGLFEVVWCQPCRGARKPPAGRTSSGPAEMPPVKLDIDINEIGANRGKGKEREWVKEVERARNAENDEEERDQERERAATGDQMFDWTTMENVYAGHCNERCRVLCTVELGLAFSRRLPEEEREESVDGDGMVVSNTSMDMGAGSRPTSRVSATSSLSRPVSMGGVGLDGVVGGKLSMSMSGSSTAQTNGTMVADGKRMARNLLLKPKVLLESVVDIL